MLRNSIFYFKDLDETKFLETCQANHMTEEPFVLKMELTNIFVDAITSHSQIPAHKVYFKYNNTRQMIGFEIETTPILHWIDTFSIFYDFPSSFKNQIFYHLPFKIFASTRGGKPTLSPNETE